MRVLWATIGFVALGLGLVGAALPILPTVPFLLVAAFAFSRSSPRFYSWLMRHRVFGPQIRNWRDHRAISARAKVLAVLSMAGSLVLGFVLLPIHIWWAQVVIMVAAAAFVLSRPTPPPGGLIAMRRNGSSA